jgi:diguanylate cyclase (GGDEF)-like protein/PAS domain S-box-containing protein/putative nucleotidyltransferase with HDIG domain
MKLFWKIYAGVFLLLLVTVVPSSYLLSLKQFEDARATFADEHEVIGRLIYKQMEVGYLESKWPFESLNQVASRKETLFWWVVKEDGTIHLANDAAFMGTNANAYFPDLKPDGRLPSSVAYPKPDVGIAIHPFQAGREKWAFWLGFSTKELSALRHRVFLQNALLAVLIMVVIGGVLYVLVRHYTRPVRSLVQGAAILGAGNLAHRVRIESKDELGLLARSFNTMAEDLQGTTVSRDYVDSILTAMSDVMLVVDSNGLLQTVNQAACELTGYRQEELLGRPASLVLPLAAESIAAVLGARNTETHILARDGRAIPILLSCSMAKDADGYTTRFVCSGKDITQRKAVEEKIRYSEQRFRDIADNALEWIWELDAEGRYVYSSPLVENILGYKPEEVLGMHWYDLLHPDDRARMMAEFPKIVASGQPFRELLYRNRHKDGHEVWLSTTGVPLLDEQGRPAGCRGADTDITLRRQAEEALKAANHRLQELATTDGLTGLVNRRRFLEKVEAEVALTRRHGHPLSLIMIDVDQFKNVNDTYGHAFGDRALCEVAKLLQHEARETDIVARYAGDEFMILMPSTDDHEAVSAAERIRKKMARRLISDGKRTAQVTLSAGIAAVAEDHITSPEALIRLADEALYAAKHSGRDCTRTWEQVGQDPPQDSFIDANAAEDLRRQVANFSQQSQEIFIESVQGLVQALDARDPYTRSHSENVTRLSVAIAETLRLNVDDIAVIRRAALIHDIGKIGVPDSILRKPGPLTPGERRIMEQHSLVGVRILDQMRFLEREVPIVRHHHERWDGKGYPDNISGEAIPMGARILAVADAFDAITSQRVYRTSRPVAEALQILIEGAGTQFAPEAVDALVTWLLSVSRNMGGKIELTPEDLLSHASVRN